MTEGLLSKDDTPSRRPVLFLLRHLWSFRAWLVQAIIMMFIMAIVNIPLPMLNMVAIDYMIPSGEAIPLALLVAFAFLARSLASGFQILQNFYIRRVMASLGDRLRKQMIHSMLSAPYGRFVVGEIGGYVGRLSSDVLKIENLIMDITRFVIRPVGMILVMVAVMSLISVPATLIILASSPIAVFSTRRLQRDVRRLQRETLEIRQRLQEQTTEVFDNIRVIRCFLKEKHYTSEVKKSINQYTDASVLLATRQGLIQSLINLILVFPWLLIVVAGGWMVQTGQLTLGGLMAFVSFEQLMHSPLGQLSRFVLLFKSDLVGIERVQEVVEMEKEEPMEPAAEAWIDDARRGELVFDGVEFYYRADVPLLHRLDLRVKPGERVAIVGPSGAGKSTIVNLVLGFYHPIRGEIRIDGSPIADLGLRGLRERIGVVFQDNPMFDATFRENLLLGSQHSDEAIWDALRRADAEDFVRSLPKGLDTMIGVKGLKLSGGQRQRLAIARVILRDPAIILMDEATSSLDSVSEHQIQLALEELLSGRTSLTIAHRLSTVVGADRILYLDEGQIIESGRHEDLLRSNGQYAELFRTQVSGMWVAQ